MGTARLRFTVALKRAVRATVRSRGLPRPQRSTPPGAVPAVPSRVDEQNFIESRIERKVVTR